MSVVLAVALPAFACAVVLAVLLRFRRVPLDVPNERSLHSRPVPRVGGIGIAAGMAAAIAAGVVRPSLVLLLALVLGALSFLDDLKPLPTGMRLAAHLAAAAALVWYTFGPMDPLGLGLLVLAVAWMTNLYNFMDGSDGLAGGMALIGFGTYAIAANVAGHASLSALSVALTASAGAFLLFNFPPARIFLGDVGSVPLGFLAGALGLVGWRDDLWPLWFPLLVFAPFIGDATLTLARRFLRGEKVWRAHREHYYQRLVRMGAGHRGTALVGYALMLVCAAAALYGRNQRPALQAASFAFAGAILLGFAAWIDLRWARHVRAGRASS